MAARTKAQVREAPQGKGREIAGIGLLGFGIFCTLSLLSKHAGSGTMMGPGGKATAAGLYSLAGVSAYLIVAALLVVAVRVFRGRPVYRSLGEVFGVLGVLAGSTVLLHLPFAGGVTELRGPGGLLGQWLGEVTASFVGTVGAGLGGALTLVSALLVLTNVTVTEVTNVLAAGAQTSARALAGAGRSATKMVVAMFPERTDRELLESLENPFEDHDSQQVQVVRRAQDDDDDLAADDDLDDTITTPADQLPVIHGYDRTIKGMPAAPLPRAALPPMESEPVRVGRGGYEIEFEDDQDLRLGSLESINMADNDVDDEALTRIHGSHADDPGFDSDFELSALQMAPRREPRRALSAVVAEVAAIECAAQAAPVAAVAAAVAALPDRTQEVASIVPAPIISTPVDRPVGRPVAAPPIIVENEVLRPKLPPSFEERAAAQALKKEEKKDDGPGFIRLSEGDFKLPQEDLLEYVPPPAQEIDKQGLYDMAARLEQAMSNYGVKGNVSAINMGPVVTMYEFAPAPGTRTGKIAQLENDLAMALEAQAVRIVAPIPGKAVVGVEVPNQTRQTVYLKEILADDAFRGAGSKLQIGLGKDIKGNSVSVNLAKMPHLLVAGTTGSGKSVTVNGMITSLLYNATPEEVRFIMVDPKMLELSIYEGIPHLLLPVVTDPKKANLALRWAVDEMERRYELLSKSGVRDISSYNAKVEIELGKRAERKAGKVSGKATGAPVVGNAVEAGSGKQGKRLKVVIAGPDGTEQEVEVESGTPEAEAAQAGIITDELREQISDQAASRSIADLAQQQADNEPLRKLPFVVIVIDEFADLMMVAPKDVETSVARIAQKARAAGLHLILATQRPSVDVITGLIKANFPSRIALQVASKIDSRTILDQPGAETLLGNGDMLFSDRGTKLRRIHGAFLSDDEVHRVVDFLKAQAKPVYDMDILKPRPEEGEEGEGAPVEEFNDPLYDQAVAIVCETRQASVSFIQRRLQIGYNRSARMVEAMERDGIVGPANGIKPREVLAPAGEYLHNAS
jgi:S-DNA-T family DNA segregation ATPase FtsK/SpoIIIE